MWQLTRLFGFGAIVAPLLALAGTEEVFAQKKDKKADTTAVAATAADYILMQKNKEVLGTIVSASGGLSVTFRVDTPHMEPNPNYKPPTVTNPKAAGYNQQANQQYQQLRQYQDIQRQMQQAQNAKSPQERQRAMQRLQMDMARLQQQQQQQYSQIMQKAGKSGKAAVASNSDPFRLVHQYKDYEFELQEGAVLRKMFLPTEFDDTGNKKEYTEKVKAELRGTDKTKPGYSARMDELVAGAEAKLTLEAPKTTKKASPKEDEGVGNVERPTIKMVVLTKESLNPTVTSAVPPKKKDKK